MALNENSSKRGHQKKLFGRNSALDQQAATIESPNPLQDESRSHVFPDQRCWNEQSVQSEKRNACDRPIASLSSLLRQCSSPLKKSELNGFSQAQSADTRTYNDDDGFRISTNVTVLKMLLLFAAISLFSVGAFAIKVKRELVDLRAEYDLMLKGVQYLQSNSDSNYSHVANLLLSEIHEFDDKTGNMRGVQPSDHDLDEARKGTKSFLHFVSCIARHFKDNEEDTKKSIELLFSQCKLYEENVDGLTKELENTKAYLHLAFAMMNRKNSVDEKELLHEIDGTMSKQQAECDEKIEKLTQEKLAMERGVYETCQETFKEKELILLRENLDLRRKLHNTTSFLHLGIYYIKEQHINCDSLVEENDFLYDIQDKMTKERADFHKRIENLTKENLALLDKMKLIQNEKDHLRRSLHQTASFLHVSIFYILETSSNYEDLLGQNDFLYKHMEKMGMELNMTRACIQMHPHPRWDNVRVNANADARVPVDD